MNIASLDIDPQKGFTPICNELPIADGHKIVDELNLNAKLAGKRILSRDLHITGSEWDAESPEDTGSSINNSNPNVDVKWTPHCIHGTKGAQILDGLPNPITGYDFHVVKGTETDAHPYGACYTDLLEKQHTGLIAQLKFWEIETVIVGGLALDFCVKNTIRQLREADFKVLINLSACKSVFPQNDHETLLEISSFGAKYFNNAKEIEKELGAHE